MTRGAQRRHGGGDKEWAAVENFIINLMMVMMVMMTMMMVMVAVVVVHMIIGDDLLFDSCDVVYWTRPPPAGPDMLKLGRLSICWRFYSMLCS